MFSKLTLLKFVLVVAVANAIQLKMNGSDPPLVTTKHSGAVALKPLFSTNENIKGTDLGYLPFSLSPAMAQAINPNEVEYYCAPLSCIADKFAANKNLKFAFQNPYNPSAGPDKTNAFFQVFAKKADGSNTYNDANNMVNYLNNNDGGFFYRNETIIPYDSAMFPPQSEICVAVTTVGYSGIFSFLIEWTSQSPTQTVWKVGDSGPWRMPDLQSNAQPMRQFIHVLVSGATVDNFDHYHFRTKFCASGPGWDATVHVMAATPLSAFSTFACSASASKCLLSTPLNWVGQDPSGTSYNTVGVSASQLASPDIHWSVYGIGANTNLENNFEFTVEFS